MLSKLKVAAKPRKKQRPGYISDDEVREHLWVTSGMFDSWITPDLIKAQRKIMEAKRRNQALLANAGDYD